MKILGLNISRAKEQKESTTWSAVMAFMGGQEAVYTPTDYGTLAKAGYQMCSSVYAAVSLIARSTAGIRWTVNRKASDGTLVELDKHPLLDLLARPNEYDSGYRFVEAIISYKLLAGNSYIEKVHGLKSAPPRYLYPLRPERMTVKPGNAEILVSGYYYEANGVKKFLDPENVLHMKDFHPLHDFYGLSRLEVAAKSIDISNWSQEWNLKLLQNDMRPPGMLILNGLTEAQSERLRNQLKDRYTGAENAGRHLVIENAQGAEWKPLSITPRDADWLEADKKNLRRICSVFNISSELLGDSENKTYANMQEARKALYQEAVLPEMDGLCDALNSWLAPYYGDGIVLGYDRDSIEALQEDRAAKYAYLGAAKWLTVNEKREACGYDAVEGGDVVLVSMGDVPLTDAIAPAGEPSELPEPVPEEPESVEEPKAFRSLKSGSLGTFWRGKAERKALWQNFERRVVSKERALAGEMKAYLNHQADEIVAKVERADTPEAIPAVLLDVEAEVKAYVEKFTPRYWKLYASAVAAGRLMTEGKLYEFEGEDKADAALEEKGLAESVRLKLLKLIREAAKFITDETIKEVQAVLRKTVGTNLTIAEIAAAIKDKLKGQMSPMRARRIARTETAMLENQGGLDGFKENEFVNRKGWMCSFVEDSRDAHIEADGLEAGIDESFSVDGEELDYPLDRSHGASAGNVVNCLCTIYPVVEA